MRLFLFAGVAAALCVPAIVHADPHTRTVTVDAPRYEGSRTTTRDRETGTVDRDAELTRRSDGATATREYDRQRTDSGVVASGSTTRFNGDTRSFDYQRERTGRFYRAEGNVTGFNGETYDYDAAGRRTPNGFVRHQGVRNDEGELVAGRRVAVRQGPNGGVVRRATSVRAPAVHRGRRGR
jgi:hypothetical protein